MKGTKNIKELEKITKEITLLLDGYELSTNECTIILSMVQAAVNTAKILELMEMKDKILSRMAS